MHCAPHASSLHAVPLRPAGEPASLERLFAFQPVETLAAGQAVFWEGDDAAHVFQILEGCVRLYRILPDGRRAVTGFVFGGELLGVSYQGPYLHTAEAVNAVRLRRIGLHRLQGAMDATGALRGLLLVRMYEEMRAAQHHIILLGQLSAVERVAAFLVAAARRIGCVRGHPAIVDLPMSRLDIADHLGLTIETVCRVFAKLRRSGVIALEGRHRIVLTHWADLQRLSGDPDWRAAGTPAPILAAASGRPH